MNAFKSEKTIGISVPDLSSVSSDLIRHFQERGFQTTRNEIETGGWEVSITKGGMFKAALGLKTALKIEIVPQTRSTVVRAGAGVFGRQAVPTTITMLVAWPVLLTQMWGVIHQAGLDNEAISVVELSLNRLSRLAQVASLPEDGQTPRTAVAAAQLINNAQRFCVSCSREQAADATFCPWCGKLQEGYETAR